MPIRAASALASERADSTWHASKRGARTRACRVGTPADAGPLGREASRRVSTLHALVRAPRQSFSPLLLFIIRESATTPIEEWMNLKPMILWDRMSLFTDSHVRTAS